MSTEARPAKRKPPTPAKASATEALPHPLSKQELRPMINRARRHARAVKRHAGLWAIELRLLQEAQVHLTYGRKSFGEWAEIEFVDFGLTAGQADKFSQEGRVILALHRNERVDLEDPRTFPGSTGARALASVAANHDDQTMLEVFDHCPPGHVVAKTVRAAAGALLPPPPATAPPQIPPHEDEDEEPEQEPPAEVQRLQASIERIRDLLDELYLAEEIDPVAVQRAYEHLLEDTQALGSVLDAVLPVEVE